MLSDFLKKNIKSQASYVAYGYGQVEPNHLSAQRTAQIYAQLPAAADINVLEQGQFVKYDYANGVCDFTGAGEWMLVYNEIKLYREHQLDCEFAMVKDNYQARIYSPADADTNFDAQSRWYNGVDDQGRTGYYVKSNDININSNKTYYSLSGNVYSAVESPEQANIGDYYEYIPYDDVTAGPDMYEINYNEDPFHIESTYDPKRMPIGTTMVPRVFKTNIGDIFTTNTIDEEDLAVGDVVAPSKTNGILSKSGDTDSMKWQVVKVYTMPDHQKGVKLMRIA